jgi:hypothetical protein
VKLNISTSSEVGSLSLEKLHMMQWLGKAGAMGHLIHTVL